MRIETPEEKVLERARSMTLARIIGRGKRPRPAQVMVMPDGKVHVDAWYPPPPPVRFW